MTRGAEERAPERRLLQLTAFVSALDLFAMPPMLVAMAVGLDLPLADVVHVAGAYFLVYGLMQPVWGLVTDHLGLVRTMRLTLFASGLCALLSALAWGPVSLLLTRAFAGGFFGAAFPSMLIYLGDTVPPARRQQEITHLMTGVALGTATASAGAAALAQALSWRAGFLVTGASAMILALALRRLPDVPRLRAPVSVLAPVVSVLSSGSAVTVLALAFVEGAVLLGALTLLPAAVEASGSSTALAGTVTAAYGVGVLVFARLVGRLSRSVAAHRLIALGGAAALLGCATFAVSQSPAVAVLAAALLALAWAAMHSSLQTWATEVLPPARAAVVSMFAGCLFLGSAASAVVVAGWADDGRYGDIYVLAALVSIPLGLGASTARAGWAGQQREPA